MNELKPGWKRVKFGEVVRLVKETCKDPVSEGIERVIGLEHIEPGDLRVRRWADIADGTTFTTRVRPGQVLFGKRRAYQRKVALADFDAVCSGDIYVFETGDPSRLLPELLPFLCQTEAFFDYAIGTSAGSLSPRTNWQSLKSYEFMLPSISEQRRFADVLCQAQNVLRMAYDAKTSAIILFNSLLSFEYNKLNNYCSLQSVSKPIVRGIDSPGPNIPGGIPYVRIAEMTGPEGILVNNLLRTAPAIANDHPDSRLEEGDFVVALRGVVGFPVRVPKDAVGANLSRGTARLSITKTHNSHFYYYALKSPNAIKNILKHCTGWKGEDLREITLGALREIPVPSIERTRQDEIAERLLIAESAIHSTESRILRIQSILAALLVELSVGTI